MEELRGILVAVATPLTEDGEEVDWGGLSALVDSPQAGRRSPHSCAIADRWLAADPCGL